MVGSFHGSNPFTPESDQCQNSPAASKEIWHHTVWRTWLFIAYSDEKWLYYKFSLHHSYNRFLKGWENTLFELRSERVNCTKLWANRFRQVELKHRFPQGQAKMPLVVYYDYINHCIVAWFWKTFLCCCSVKPFCILLTFYASVDKELNLFYWTLIWFQSKQIHPVWTRKSLTRKYQMLSISRIIWMSYRENI